jgi:predicted RND superfamily exporter protein
MGDSVVERLSDVVTAHNVLILLSLTVLTVGVFSGVFAEGGATSETGINISDTEVGQATEYVSEHYDDGSNTTTEQAYVRATDGSVLSKEVLIATIDYQREVASDPAINESLVGGGVDGPPNVVARALVDGSDPSLAEQRSALESASAERIRRVVAETFTGGETTRTFLPTSYEPGSTAAGGMRVTFEFAQPEGAAQGTAPEVERALYETTENYGSVDVFTVGAQTWSELNEEYLVDTLWLVLPPILVVMLVVLAFAYRNVVDVAVGLVGTIVALLWTFGLMGWLGVFGRRVALVAPVLIIALSLDFGLHVFMRYREVGGKRVGIRESMTRSVSLTAVPFLLVTVTAVVGFVPSVTNPVPVIRDLGVAIMLGTAASLLVFLTFVPALKVTVERLLDRVGYDGHSAPLGEGKYLRRVLSLGLRAARRGAPVVVLVAVIGATAGGYAFTELERGTSQQTDFDVAEWKTDLPGPMAFDTFESDAARQIVFERRFQPDNEVSDPANSIGSTQFLITGSVTDPEAFAAVTNAKTASENASGETVLKQGGSVEPVSPLSVMERVAASNPSFADTFEAADSDADGVPEQDFRAVYDDLYSVAPDRAARVIERTDRGAYRSLRVFVPARPSADSDRADEMRGIAASMERASGMEVTAVGVGTVSDVRFTRLVDGIVRTMLLALGAVFLLLVGIYQVRHGSALLGAITGVPVVLTLGFVFGGMYLAGVALTFETALLVSITIGLGVDYSIHVSSRTVQELEQGATIQTALSRAITGTGGALLGSAVTSGGAFSLMLISQDPRLQSFGLIVAFALAVSFCLSVFVLPSLLFLWAGSRAEYDTTPEAQPTDG